MRVLIAQGIMPSASNYRAKKFPPKAEYPPEVAEVRLSAIPVQIDSIRSHGERSGNPFAPGQPGANDRVQYRTHFRAVIRAKYKACFCSMRAMVISSGVCSKASYHSFEVVLILPASAGVHQADASLSVSRARGPVRSP